MFPKTLEEHVEHLQQVFDILQANQFVGKQSCTCCCNLPEILKYFGHAMDPAQVKARL